MGFDMTAEKPTELRVAIAGLGSIGSKIAREFDRGIDGMILSAVAVRDLEKHREFLSGLRAPPAVLPIDRLWEAADAVVECAPSHYLRGIVEPMVARGKTAIVLSAGALLDKRKWRPNHSAYRGADRPRRGDRSGSWYDLFG
jgi:aspartate dehydrogenase